MRPGPGEEPVPPAETGPTDAKPVPDASRRLRFAVAALFAVVLAGKAVFASQVGLYFDEALYWQCAQRLAFAYADHPFMTALLVRAGTSVLGDTPLGVRLMFLVAGAALPFAVGALARPVVGARLAWIAAGISLLAPILAAQGMLAVPDAVLAVVAAAAIAAFERATRTGTRGAWLAAGLVAALGFCTHYRFVLVAAAAGVYLVLTRNGRACLRTPGPWIAMAVAAAGFLPLLAFNVEHGFAPIRYQFVDRHAAGAKGARELLVHPAEQAGAVTPVLYAAMLAALVAAWRRARAGDDRSALLATFATVPIATYFLTSPVAGDDLAHFHWPAWGYIPLCVCLADSLDRLARRGGWRRAAAAAVPASAVLVVLALSLCVVQDAFDVRARIRALTDWTGLARRVRARLPAAPPGALPIVVADSYVQASQIDFALGGAAEVFTLDHRRNREHGRALQYRIWGLDEAGLRERPGREVLVVVEATDFRLSGRTPWFAHVAEVIEGSERAGVFKLPPWGGHEATRFAFFTGRVPAR